MFCSKCGAQIMDEAVVCPKCGCATRGTQPTKIATSSPASVEQPVNVNNTINSIRTLGIVSIVFALLFALVGWICSIIGIVKSNSLINMGVKDSRLDSARNLNIIGMAISAVSSILGIILMVC